ncbi:MAG: DNA primase [Prevotella sp.]|jgi:DNA primase
MIDRLTVERIKDAANIVEVVQDYVSLKKSGANYKGLCPFHNEKTPSFIVSPARGTCHCFGCGKGGNAVSFLMEIEQITYPEALRRLAAKYHIEIKERELTDREKEERSQRESMFIMNDWATGYFENILHNDADGVAIGMQYFRSRGFRDDIIRKFRLGYDLADRRALAREAIRKGYQSEYIKKVGLCYENDRGELIDRYSGRVIFPWMNNSGRIVGFSARVLDQRTKGVEQKYVNSPDSDIFHKDHELYGFYQAKQAINREGFAFIVEGQADVISMHQCGVENVVAGSGTALSAFQIHLLHRFVDDITLIYDDDAAGHHAALEGIDKVLAEGMNVRVVVMPDGDDPDSFARKHTAADFRRYVEEHQVDFIQYKTQLLLDGVTDPQQRANGVDSIVESISYVQNQVLRDTYLHDSAQRLGYGEQVLINQMNNFIRSRRNGPQQPVVQAASPSKPPMGNPGKPLRERIISEVERMLIQLVIRHGEWVIFNGVEGDDGKIYDLNIAQYVQYTLKADNLTFHEPLFNQILDEAVEKSSESGFKAESYFLNHHDNDVAQLAAELTTDAFHLSGQSEPEPINEEDRKQKLIAKTENLRNQTMHLVLDFKKEYVDARLHELQDSLKQTADDRDKMMTLMQQYRDLQEIRNGLARQLGSDILV